MYSHSVRTLQLQFQTSKKDRAKRICQALSKPWLGRSKCRMFKTVWPVVNPRSSGSKMTLYLKQRSDVMRLDGTIRMCTKARKVLAYHGRRRGQPQLVSIMPHHTAAQDSPPTVSEHSRTTLPVCLQWRVCSVWMLGNPTLMSIQVKFTAPASRTLNELLSEYYS